MPLKKCINLFRIDGGYRTVAPLEMPDDKRDVNLRRNGFQLQHVGTVVERPGGRCKHLLHHVAFAPGKDKMAVLRPLDVSPQQSLYILLRIFGNLLELVNRYDARLVRMSQILENLIERIFGPLDISQLHIESGKIGDGVEPEFPADGLNRLNEKSRHFTTTRQECFVNLPAEQIGKFAEARRMQNIDEKSIVLLTDFRLVVTELNQPCFTHTAR